MDAARSSACAPVVLRNVYGFAHVPPHPSPRRPGGATASRSWPARAFDIQAGRETKARFSAERTRLPKARSQQLTIARRKPPGGIACALGGFPSSKVIWIDGGRVVMSGDPREVIEAYRSRTNVRKNSGEPAGEE